MGLSDYLDSFSVTRRSRAEVVSRFTGGGHRLIANVPYQPYTSRAATGWAEETTSLNNPQWRYRKGQARDIGGPFFNRKVTVEAFENQHSLRTLPGNVTGTYLYSGPLYPGYDALSVPRLATAIYDGTFRTQNVWTSDNSLSREDLRAEGLKFMVAASPASPAFSLANSLGELISEKKFFAVPGREWLRESGRLPSEWLNLQFGILPVLSDAQDFIDVSKRSEQIIAQYRRDAGKVVRRKRKKPILTEVATATYSGSHNHAKLIGPPSTVLNSGLYRNQQLHVHQRKQVELWFSGSYQYFFPPQAEGYLAELLERNAVYGYLPSPSTLWELTPFSWLTDWFVNTGDIMSSMFGAGPDASVLIRGYVMAKTTTKTTLTWTGDLAVNGSWRRSSMKWITTEVVQQRERTRPYGVDWKAEGLTPKQLSILTALGLSRR